MEYPLHRQLAEAVRDLLDKVPAGQAQVTRGKTRLN